MKSHTGQIDTRDWRERLEGKTIAAADYLFGTWKCPMCKNQYSVLANCRVVAGQIICMSCFDSKPEAEDVNTEER